MKIKKNGKWIDVVPKIDIGTMSVFIGASSSSDGTKGAVPAPAAGDQEKFLKANGTWSNTFAGTLVANTFKTSSGIEIY